MFEEIKEMLSSVFSSDVSEAEEAMNIFPLFIGIISVLIAVFFAWIAFVILKRFWKKNRFMKHKKDFLCKMHNMDCFSLENPDSVKLRNLALECWQTGYLIDEHTDRLNNVLKVSDIVYKMAVELKLEKIEQALYFCVAMVYDLGFLDIPGYIFMTEILNQEEKKLIKTHVLRFQDQIDFIPEEWQLFFTQAVMCHHENFDGTGYPGGFKEEEIPLIARVIRIAESYVSLTAFRAYHRVKNSFTALAELKSDSSYDMELLDILEKVLKKEL